MKIICIPGERICEATSKHVAGYGTYMLNKDIYASLMGQVVLEEKDDLIIVKVYM